MKREIKFRGLRTDGKGWVYGYYFYDNQAIQSYIIDDETNVDVFSESVGQFTGLKDVNGTDIYEGDIFTANEYPFKDGEKPNYNGVVEWIFAGFQYYLTCVNKDKRGISEGINEILEDGSWIEIIGNIHQK